MRTPTPAAIWPASFISLAGLLLAPACFAPNVGIESTEAADTEAEAGTTTTAAPATSTAETSATSSARPTTPDNPLTGSTTANSTTGPAPEDSSSTTSGDPTEGPPRDSDDGPTSSAPPESTGGQPDPFCGDGDVDSGEECDNGLENNGLNQHCLPDCVLNVCGDSNVGPGEVCDDGDRDNVLMPGACAPDCSTVIGEKLITFSGVTEGGNYQPNPVGYADSRCPAGSLALFAVPGVRQATNGTPYAADALLDWPVSPYTAYTRADGSLIWITDDVPLLGVRAGSPQPLDLAIRAECTTEFCAFNNNRVVTGLNANWTNASVDTCDGWSSTSENVDFAVGASLSATEFLDSNEEVACSFGTTAVFGGTPRFYCIEQ